MNSSKDRQRAVPGAILGLLTILLGFIKQAKSWDARYNALLFVAFELGIAELGLMGRTFQWLTSTQTAELSTAYTVALGVGNLTVAFLRIGAGRLIRIAIFGAAIPIVGIAAAVAVFHPKSTAVFLVALALWVVSGFFSGAQDPVKNLVVTEIEHDEDANVPAGPFNLAVQYLGICIVPFATLAMLSLNIGVPIEYLGIAVILIIVVPLTRGLPNIKESHSPDAEPAAAPPTMSRMLGLGVVQVMVLTPTSMGFGQIPDFMVALGASAHVATTGTVAYTVSAMVSCLAWDPREKGWRTTRAVALRGLVVALVGVAALTISVLKFFDLPHLAPGLAQAIAIGGLAAVAWGVAPLVMIVFRGLKSPEEGSSTSPRRRIGGEFFAVAVMTVIQDIGVAGSNAIMGALIGPLGQPVAFVLVVAAAVFGLCLGFLLIKEEWLERSKQAEPAPGPEAALSARTARAPRGASVMALVP